jgi:hypothetical protein
MGFVDEIKDIIDEISNASLEANMKIASLAIISNSGNIVYQTTNFDISNQVTNILNVVKGDSSFFLNNLEFIVTGNPSEGIIGSNKSGMGHVIIIPFKGGVLASYALPQADPKNALAFLKAFVINLNGKV